MSLSDRTTISGWGVFRPAPWHLEGIYDGKEEASAKWLQMDPEYIVRRGAGCLETGEFEEAPANA